MIENAKTVDDKDGLISDYFRLHKTMMKGLPTEAQNKYISIIDNIISALNTFDHQFNYIPSELPEFCERIELNVRYVLMERRFLCKYDEDRLISMFTECLPIQLRTFRNMLNSIYKNNENNTFDIEEKEYLGIFRDKLRKMLRENNKMGKIQRYQIENICEDIDRYYKTMISERVIV